MWLQKQESDRGIKHSFVGEFIMSGSTEEGQATLLQSSTGFGCVYRVCASLGTFSFADTSLQFTLPGAICIITRS